MKQTIKQCLTGICFAALSIVCFAYDIEADGIRYNIVSSTDKTCEVAMTHELFSLYSGRVVVPGHISFEDNEFTIIGIGENAFLGSDITEVIIPKTAKYIGETAFKGCTSLTNVILPESLDSIGEGAFMYCWELETVELPKSLKTLGCDVFMECKKLQSVCLPNELTNLGYKTFYNCPELYNIVWSSALESIGESAFEGCTSLKELSLPHSLLSIDSYAFKGCIGIENLDLPTSLTSIGANAFEGCSGIEELSLPSSLKSVGWSAFSKCTRLKVLSFYDTQFDAKAFSGCEALKTINAMSKTPPIGYYNDTFDDNCYKTAFLYVPKNTKQEYQNKYFYIWKNFDNIIEKDFDSVDDITADDGDIRVAVHNGQIAVSGAYASEEVNVYNMSGMEIYRGTDRTIALPTKGIYVVKVAERNFKVAL